ncbi:cytochrome B [Methyloceanibacter superfactus]|jgi:cytochrome b|uniref:Cytochrome B n=1 Tax=Methyloceanibacter superfactus TaxID=1774969 RepID=A0A1E3VXP8_9HYPH|nr:cytochrome b/b6 domain-containing protein [Methyloceanibacter superfactus]ODR98317.1 cytochrome B [Methyloceanibacter superfactus]
MATTRVWDIFVRVFHWSLVASLVVAWLSGDDWKTLHLWAGYSAAALIAMRLVWGVIGTPHARFSQFVKSPLAVASYLKEIATGREARHLGHNPAGGAMIVALLATLIGLCLSGWLLTTDAFWGSEMMEDIHETLANLALVLVGLHVGGVLWASFRHHENLIRAMVTGRKRAPETGDVL